MTFWEFAAKHPITALLMVIFVVMLIRSLGYRIASMWSRWCRTRNISAHGWPEAPIDADGDVVRPVCPDEVAEAVIEKLRDQRERGWA